MAKLDYVIIGSGINALVCAAMLSRDKRVMVLEREDVIGGTMRTDELAPGFSYDPLALTFVLLQASPAFAKLQAPLARNGATFCTTDAPTGVLMGDGRSLVLGRDRAANAARFDALHPGDGAAYTAEMAGIDGEAPLLFGLFNNALWSRQTATMLTKYAAKRGPRALATFFGDAFVTNRRRLGSTYGSDLVEALFAPWPLHAGLDPEQPFSGKMGAVMTYALEAMGAPVAAGGAARVPEALRAIIEKHKGVVRTGCDVDEIMPGTDGRDVAGVRLTDGEEIIVPSAICSVTPTQLYGRLLRNWELPAYVAKETARYQYGKGNMQLHYALKSPVAWPDASLAEVQLLHLSDGVDAVSKATNEAERGMLPVRPTVCVGQPSAADPSRAPDGQAVLWIQLPECPTTLKGDAAGEIEVPDDGRWNEAVREAYADRVEAMIAAHVPGFRDTVIARRALSPADIEAMNINLVGGDPYAGWCGLDQFFLFRPFPQQVNHKTPARHVYHIGASTHPGPGLSGTSGYLLAKKLAPWDIL
ncbi:MAG: NAD(P)/FAD-dependent oxidoreductase [Pseudomonadota bacterium]